MRKITLLFSVLALAGSLFLLGGCNDDDIETTPLGSVNMNLYENLFYNGREFYLHAQTDQGNYPLTYYIRNSIEVDGQDIKISLKDIEKISSGSSSVALGPASAYIYVGNLSNGTYNLEIDVAGNVNQTTLSVIDALYAVDTAGFNNLSFNFDTLYRIPSGTLWGYVGYQNTAYTDIAEAFRDSLNAIGATSIGLTPGEYGYFTISESGTFNQPISENYEYYREFFKFYDGSEYDLNEIVEYYTLNYRPVSVQLFWVFEEGEMKSYIKPDDVDVEASDIRFR